MGRNPRALVTQGIQSRNRPAVGARLVPPACQKSTQAQALGSILAKWNRDLCPTDGP
jgi:hypothetical protein